MPPPALSGSSSSTNRGIEKGILEALFFVFEDTYGHSAGSSPQTPRVACRKGRSVISPAGRLVRHKKSLILSYIGLIQRIQALTTVLSTHARTYKHSDTSNNPDDHTGEAMCPMQARASHLHPSESLIPVQHSTVRAPALGALTAHCS